MKVSETFDYPKSSFDLIRLFLKSVVLRGMQRKYLIKSIFLTLEKPDKKQGYRRKKIGWFIASTTD